MLKKEHHTISTFFVKLMFNLKIIAILVHTINGDCQADWPKCSTEDNVVCRHGGSCDPQDSECKPVVFTNALRNSIVVKHNDLRNSIAGGRDNRGGAKPGGNIRVMNYDFELEYSASCTANTCKMEHESCRKTKTFTSAGQNLYKGGSGSITHAIGSWYEKEIGLMTSAKFDSFGDAMAVGHFTQVVWAATTHVGCAAAQKGNAYFVACNYGPMGNMKGSSVYSRGSPASKCPKGVKVCRDYHSLCGVAYKLKPMGTDFVKMNHAYRPHLAILLMYMLVCISLILF